MVFRVIGRLTVRFFRWLGRILVGTGRATGRHLIVSTITSLLLLILAVIIFQTNLFGVLNSKEDFNIEVPASDPLSGQSSPAPSNASVKFVAGLYYFDSQRIWDSLSDRFRASLQARQIDKNSMQGLIDSELAGLKKQNLNLKYVKVRFEGSTDLNGGLLEGYTNFWRAGDHVGNAGYTLILDKDQKVDGVQTPSDAPEPLISSIFYSDKAAANGSAVANNTAVPTTPKAEAGTYGKQTAPAAEDFMSGITNFDAAKVWSSLSTGLQKQLTDQKISQDTIQKTFDSYRSDAQKSKQSLSYQGYALYEKLDLTGERTLSKYESVLTLSGTVHSYQYELFVDSSGKVTNYSFQDPILSKAFGIQQSTTSSGG